VDALAAAAIIGIIVVGLVAAVDLARDGEVEPAVLALLVATISPLVPALLVRYNRSGNGKP
jgi:hypothetical protein